METLELRWFTSTTVAEAQLRAFAQDAALEARTDLYLLGTGASVGIKRRGVAERLEHKRRLSACPVDLSACPVDLAAGVVEAWRKSWLDSASLPARPCWAPVVKLRAQRRIGGCRAELTRIDAAPLGPEATTLAIECDDLEGLDELLAATAQLHRRFPELATQFADAESLGYPAWLEQRWARWGSNPRPSG